MLLWAGMVCQDSAKGQVVINEIMASNDTTLADEDGDNSDWIELYNRGADPVLLGYYSLSDDFNRPFRWVLPDVQIEPGEFLLVWASGKERSNPDEPLHTSFRLNQDGEEVLLTDIRDGTRLDEWEARPIPTDISYGRYPDGGPEKYYFFQPTPGAPNTRQGYSDLLDPPVFSDPSGFYRDELTITLKTDEPDVKILYTLDGSKPDKSNLEHNQPEPFTVEYFEPGVQTDPVKVEERHRTYLYEEPIELADRSDSARVLSDVITTYYQDSGGNFYWEPPPENHFKGNVVRAAAYRDGMQSPVATANYLIAGPKRELANLPVLAVSTGMENLVGYENGIYVPGRVYSEAGGSMDEFVWEANYGGRGHDWERPVHMDLIEPDGHAVFSQNVGMRIHGGGSRHDPNKSFRLYARGRYDYENRMFFPFFPDGYKAGSGSPVDTYNRLLVRADGNLRDYLNDVVAHRIMRPAHVGVQRSRPVQHLLNGEYWGLIYLRDRLDADHIAYQYGIDPDNVVMINTPHGERHPGLVEEGSEADFDLYLDMYRYAVENDLSDPVHYERIAEMLDLKSIIDYHIVFIFLTNVDWYGSRHFRMWRARETTDSPWEDGRWRYLVWDFDETGIGRNLEYDLLFNAMSPDGSGEPPYHFGNDPDRTALFRSLLENDDFRYRFINRFADLLNSAFTSERVRRVFEEEYEQVKPVFDKHEKRWGRPPATQLRIEDFREFAHKRPEIQFGQIKENFDLPGKRVLELDISGPGQGHVRVNSLEVSSHTTGIPDDPYPWSGTWFQDVPITLEAIPAPGYAFSHWEGVATRRSEHARITLSDNQDRFITAVFKKTDHTRIPEPHDLSESDYVFDQWEPSGEPGSFPESMAFVYMEDPDPGLVSEITGFTQGPYDLDTGTRIQALDDEGVAFVNSPNPDGHSGFPKRRLGGALLSLDTRGKDSIIVHWEGGTVSPESRIYHIRLQYRTDKRGSFSDLVRPDGSPVEYVRSEDPGASETFEHIRLSSKAHDRELVQLLWRYYYTGKRADTRSNRHDALRIGNIRVSGAFVDDGGNGKPLLPDRLALHQNYPNPFNAQTRIPFSIPQTGHVRLEVFDLLGRRIATLKNETLQHGYHTVRFDAVELSTGVYLVRLESGGSTDSASMLLVR